MDSLTAEQRRGLAGTRDRLAILAESVVADYLYPQQPTRHSIDLLAAVRRRDVVLFRLDSDRRPLLASTLAAAVVQDLLTIAAELQHQPVPTLVLVDEFSAIAPAGVVRPFGRGRSAGLSLLLGTQELADLRPPDNPTLADQVLGNVTTLIARQMVPASAETLASVMGTRAAWATTERTDMMLGASSPTRNGTRTRIREFVIHPDTIKRLPTGTAAVTSAGLHEPRIARMNHPEDCTMNRPTARRCSGSTRRSSRRPRRQLLAVEPSWIYEAVRAGTLPCLRIGRHIRFTRTMLEEWLQGRVA